MKLKWTDEARKRFLKVAETYPGDPWADDAVARTAQLALDAGDHAAAFPCEVVSRAVSAKQVQGRRSLDRGQGPAGRRASPGAAHYLEALLGLGTEPGTKARTAGSQLSPAALPRARYDLAWHTAPRVRRLRPTPCSPVWRVRPKSRLVWTSQFLIGQEAVEQGHFAEAIGPLRQYLKMNPRGDVADSALAHLTTAELGLRQTDEAWKTLAQFADRFPGSKAPMPTRLARRSRSGCQPVRACRRAVPARAQREDERDRSSGSRRQARGRARRRDHSQVPRVGLGRALWRLGKPAEAATLFRSTWRTRAVIPRLRLWAWNVPAH